MLIHRATFFRVALAVALPSALLNPIRAMATPVYYTISSDATDPSVGPGNLLPGTLTGSFVYDSATTTYSSVSLDIEGVSSTNLNGNYTLYTGTDVASTPTDLLIQGITPLNAGGESNQNSLLDVRFTAALGVASDQITGISDFDGGNPAGLTTPPTIAFADGVVADVPEPVSMGILGMGLFGLGVMRRQRA